MVTQWRATWKQHSLLLVLHGLNDGPQLTDLHLKLLDSSLAAHCWLHLWLSFCAEQRWRTGSLSAVPKEDDMGEDATEEREAGPLLAAAMVPGLGGRDVLLSDTCEKGKWRGFRAWDLCRDCLPVLGSQTFLLYPTPYLSPHTLIIYSLIHKPSMACLVQTDHCPRATCIYFQFHLLSRQDNPRLVSYTQRCKTAWQALQTLK